MEAKVGSRRAAGGARARVSRHGMGGNHAVILPSGITSSGKKPFIWGSQMAVVTVEPGRLTMTPTGVSSVGRGLLAVNHVVSTTLL